MNKTRIDYLTHTWNPIAMRCTPVSEGCEHCWHLRMADRLAGNTRLSPGVRVAYRGEGGPLLVPSRLGDPDTGGTPRRIGVQLMGDLFHPDVSDLDRRDVFLQIGMCHQHTFLVLTKRPAEMRRFIWDLVDKRFFARRWWEPVMTDSNCFPNLMLGVSVENQQRTDERIPVLLDTPAAVHFVSAEPLLGPLQLYDTEGWTTIDYPTSALSLVICGAETGPGKRPMQLDWARSLRDQCVANAVPFFFKVDSQGNHELDGRVWEEMPEVRK